MKTIVLAVLCVFLFALSGIALAGGQSSLEGILSRGELVAGSCLIAPPMQFLDDEGEPVGFVVDLMELMTDKMGVTLKWVDMAWEDLIPSLLAGELDMIAANMSITLERAKTVRFSNPYFLTGIAAAAQAGSEYTEWTDLNHPDVTIGVIRGTMPAELVETAMQARVERYDSLSERVSDLQSGRIQGIVDDEMLCLEIVSRNPDLKLLSGLVKPDIYGLTFRQGDEEEALVEWVNTFLMISKLEGDYGRIYRKWAGKDWEPNFMVD